MATAVLDWGCMSALMWWEWKSQGIWTHDRALQLLCQLHFRALCWLPEHISVVLAEKKGSEGCCVGSGQCLHTLCQMPTVLTGIDTCVCVPSLPLSSCVYWAHLVSHCASFQPPFQSSRWSCKPISCGCNQTGPCLNLTVDSSLSLPGTASMLQHRGLLELPGTHIGIRDCEGI